MAVPSDLVSKLTELANREGKSFQTLLGQILVSGLKVAESGRSLEDVVDFYEMMETQRSSGAALLPLDLCSYMVSRLWSQEKDVMMEKWREAGAWYGNYLRSKFPSGDIPGLLVKLLLATRWDLRELKFTRESSRVRFYCIAPHLGDDSTNLLASFVEGAMSSLNHKMVNSEVVKGIILQEFMPV